MYLLQCSPALAWPRRFGLLPARQPLREGDKLALLARLRERRLDHARPEWLAIVFRGSPVRHAISWIDRSPPSTCDGCGSHSSNLSRNYAASRLNFGWKSTTQKYAERNEAYPQRGGNSEGEVKSLSSLFPRHRAVSVPEYR